MILLGIDTLFFLIELIIGYAVHSLALVADSFHMLNDVLSLCVGLWAVKVSNQKKNSKMYTYGVSSMNLFNLHSTDMLVVATSRNAWGAHQRSLSGGLVPLDLP